MVPVKKINGPDLSSRTRQTRWRRPDPSLLSRNNHVFLSDLEQRRFLPPPPFFFIKCVVFSLYSSPSCLIGPFYLQGDLILRFSTRSKQAKMEEVYWSSYSRLTPFLFVSERGRFFCSLALLVALPRLLQLLLVGTAVLLALLSVC